MNNDMISLAERCEAAAGPCEELDADIALAAGWKHRSGKDWHLVLPWERPCYTASIDAAMTLVPEEWTAWGVWSRRRKTKFYAVLSRLRDNFEGNELGEEEDAESKRCATPALALCAASLRARALSTVSRGGGH